MVEESNPEPPSPPDIRPFGRSSSTNHNININTKTHLHKVETNTAIESDEHFLDGLGVDTSINNSTSYSTSEYDIQHIQHVQRRRSSSAEGRKGGLSGVRHLSLPLSTFFFLCIVLCVLPIASASSLITDRTDTMLDPYTSYDQMTPSAYASSAKATPILTLLAKLFGYVGLAFTYATGVEVDNTPVGYIKRSLTQTQKVEAAMIPILVILSGIFAGLTLGYFSVDPTQLQVLSISGTPKQQAHARRILPVRKDSHLLLTTLILGNMIVNEALPVVSDPVLGGGVQAVVASTAMVVIFSEIIPQSICSRYGLLIGATMAGPVRVMIWIAFPIAWPIAKLLEYILGAHHGIIYRRSELRELIKMHAAGGAGGGDLDFDTVQMAQGALDLAQKSVKEAMTPIDQVFMLPIEAKLDYETLGHVVRSGHSRIPVYQMVEVPDIDLTAPGKGLGKTKMVKKVIGSLLVKSCVLLDPEDATPLASVPINAIPSVPYDEPMTNMLNVFQEGRSHMAIVSRRPRRVENDPEDAESVMTAAAGGLRQRFLRKVAEITHHSSDSDSSSTESEEGGADHAEKGEKKVRRKKTKRSTSGSSTTAGGSPTSTSAANEVKEQAQAQANDNEEKKKKSGAGLVQAAKLTQLEQTVPADAQIPSAAVEKFFEGLEGAPLGIITLEDVLEELIGEEIYDEYDEHGAPRSAASAFVPREAALAARKAALERQQFAQAASTPLPLTNDADIDIPPPAQTRRVMPKLPLPKFSLGKRPNSQPGRSRNADLNMTSPVAATSGPLTNAGLATPQNQESSEKPAAGAATAGGNIKRTASPGEIDITSALNAPTSATTGTTDAPKRSQSEARIASRRSSAQIDPVPASTAASPAGGTVVPLKGLDPVSAVPARLLPTGVAAPPPSNANLLSEALLIERGRRRAAAGVPGVAGASSAPPMLRVASTGAAVSTGARTVSAAPSRQPTPPSAGAVSTASAPAAPAGTGATAVAGAGAGVTGSPPSNQTGLIAPQPVQGKRMPKFKSVPQAPGSVPGTPPL